MRRERWATRLGLILAMAGNAVGLGNFLRFPVQAASNGGGAFMIPYVIALLLLGIPLMWVEWAMGRLGGERGHGTAPGVFGLMWRSPIAKYVGALGILLPTLVALYYTSVVSWTLAYAFFSALGFFHSKSPEQLRTFFEGRVVCADYWPIYVFFVVTVLINATIMTGGIARGIERLAKIAMPLLFLFALVLMVRILTLGNPVPQHPDRHVWNGMAFLWNPDMTRLSEMRIWLAAAGQIFFTLSLGFGVIICYASYLRKNDDIVLAGLSTASLNEFAEVVLGGSLAIPLAFAFLGAAGVTAVAKAGPFSLAFVTMPAVFQRMPLGQLFGTVWFLLLFFAGITSSVALAQAAVSFLEDELGWSRRRAVWSVWLLIFGVGHIILFGAGAMGEIDFWAGTVGIVLFALIEVIVFVWILGPDKAWDEINRGAQIRAPRAVYYVLKYVTPAYLAALLCAWLWQDGWRTAAMQNVPAVEIPWRWAARLLVALIMLLLLYIVRRTALSAKISLKRSRG